MESILKPGQLEVGAAAEVSLQRYPLPAGGIVLTSEASCGVLPLHAMGTNIIAVPLHDDEAFWLGLSTTTPAAMLTVSLCVKTSRHGLLDAVSGMSWNDESPASINVPPASSIDGIRREEPGLWPFSRHAKLPDAPSCSELHLLISLTLRHTNVVEKSALSFVLLEPTKYHELTGLDPGPSANIENRFGGYRLP